MSRIVDSMKTRIAKLDAKIKPLVEERNSLLQAILVLDKQDLPPAEPVSATLPGASKSEQPVFLKGKDHGNKPA